MGMKALQAGERAKELRSKRYETATQVANLAKHESVDFVIIAGDLFENHDIDETVIRKTVAVLDSFAPIPVFILPGNHDPSIPGGIWDRQSWQRVGNHVKLLTESTEVPYQNDIVLYPSPLKQKQSNLDPTAWIPSRVSGDNRIRIGIAHGSIDVLPGQVNFPIASNRAIEAELDYLALGDWHSFFRNGKTAYSGTFEQTSFSEKDSGDVIIVEIASAGTEPIVTRKHVGQLQWSEHFPTIHDLTDIEHLRSSIEGAGPLKTQLVRLLPNIEPEITISALSELVSLRNELIEEAFFLDWPEESVSVPLCADVQIPDGVLSIVDSDLSVILEGKIPDGPGRVAASIDLKVVLEAKSILRRLVMEGQK